MACVKDVCKIKQNIKHSVVLTAKFDTFDSSTNNISKNYG